MKRLRYIVFLKVNNKITHNKIEVNPKIMFGKPVIKDTRITVEQILRKLAAGLTVNGIIRDYPHIKKEVGNEFS